MKAWEIMNFAVQEIECDKLNNHNRNIFGSKEEAIKNAISRVNERVDKNLNYLERIREELVEQEGVVVYYVLKRNKLIIEGKVSNIQIDDVIL
ncbi:hypothetical protein [Clostridium tagluense]|uniref:hypothetical protein n=1 Tax=Clostridium tagluense TaxID=360422 RepID=UPI001CF27698|nr:hypothetical protein [Clostridium tagluense]MCB2299897.1 hypothetical protein [Clostridium tagluense]